MKYTYCNNCENEFDVNEIEEDGGCPYCGINCESDQVDTDDYGNTVYDYLADDIDD